MNKVPYDIKIKECNIFLRAGEILQEREKMISEICEKLFLKRGDAILAMIYYKWNVDKLDDWYENIEENKAKAGIDLSKIIDKKLKEEGIPSDEDYCLICEEKKKIIIF